MKIFKGKVISTKMDKTATIAVERTVVHPIYKKRFRRMRKYHVQDDLGAQIGDEVRFVAAKPMSKMKKWKLIKIVGKKEGTKAKKAS